MSRLAAVLSNLLEKNAAVSQWETDSVKEVGFLAALTLPYDEARIFLRYLNPNEWDYDGKYLDRLNSIHGIDDE